MTPEQIAKQLSGISKLTDADLADVIRLCKQILLERKRSRASAKHLKQHGEDKKQNPATTEADS